MERKLLNDKRECGGVKLHEWLTTLPSCAGYLTHGESKERAVHRLLHSRAALAHYGTMPQRQRTWRAHVQRQRAFQMVLRRLVGQPPWRLGEHVQHTVVGFGDWNGKGSSVSRSAAFPKLAWSHWARSQGLHVVDIDEARTSKVGGFDQCKDKRSG